ncbi:MAG: PP2C family protein-serine/threonine phosphatase [Candidatus Krumholzibacteriia bacterium]
MYKKLYRDIEKLLRQIDNSTGTEDMLRMTVRGIVETCAQVYGIESGRVYREQPHEYLLIESIGGHGSRIVGKTVSKDYPVVQTLEREFIVMISRDYPGFDPELEAQFSSLDYAAILVDSTPAYILSFGVRRTEPDETEENLHLILETIRTAVGLKLRQSVLESQLRQAQTIQLSLLPRELPKLDGFELAAATFPAEEVGGDIYDAQTMETGTITVAVADASGHGLPAALQARDVITGLRMGVARDFKITATIRRLNKVINASGLSSRFVSLFYAEIEETGNVIYVNCGHCPPLVVNPAGAVFELPSNGPVLGPLPDMTYRRSFAQLRPGEVLLIYTDGLTERKRRLPPGEGEAAPDPAAEAEQEEFGTERLIAVAREHAHRPARDLLAAVLTEVREFGGGQPWEDDATLLVVRRLPATEFKPKRLLGTVLSFDQARVGAAKKPGEGK